LSYSEINSKKYQIIKKDSTNEYWSFMQGIVIPENPNSFSYHPDYVVKNGQTKLIGKKFLLNTNTIFIHVLFIRKKQ